MNRRPLPKASLLKAELRLRIAMERARLQAEAPTWRNAAECVDAGVSAARTARLLGKMFWGKESGEADKPPIDQGRGSRLERWIETALAGWRLWGQISKLVTKKD